MNSYLWFASGWCLGLLCGVFGMALAAAAGCDSRSRKE